MLASINSTLFILEAQSASNYPRAMIICTNKKGHGLINKVINKLPIELHVPGYQFCGPGTKLQKRLARGDKGINPLDAACKEHDIAYNLNSSVKERNKADRILAKTAWQRVKSQDASLGEKAVAFAVTNIMKTKSKLGMGLKKKKFPKMSFKKVMNAASVVKMKDKSLSKNVIKSALKKARDVVRKAGGKSKIIVPRILPVSVKRGGVLPFLVPLFAGLSAAGSLAGGAAGIAKAVNASRAAKKQLEESERHNKTMEAIALGKGLYLKPYKAGLGLYLKPALGNGLKKKNFFLTCRKEL